MPKLQPLQASFESGEVSPLIQGRTQTERYQTGVAIDENFIPRSQGPAQLRNGFFHVAEFEGEDGVVDLRLCPLEVSDEERFVVAIGATNLAVFDEDGALIGGEAGIDLVSNGDFINAFVGWTTATDHASSIIEWNSEFQLARFAIFAGGGLRAARLGQALTVTQTGNHVCVVSSLVTIAGGAAMTLKVGTAFDDDSLGTATVINLIDQVLGPFALTPGTVWITFELVETGPASDTEQLLDAVRFRFVDPAPLPVEFASPWAGFSLEPLAFEQHPLNPHLMFTHPNVAPQRLTVAPGNLWTLEAIPFVAPPAIWTGTNFPAALTFGEGRFWLAGTPNEPNRFWGSKSDDYFNFTAGVAADDPVDFSISKRGRITWLKGAKNLVIGSKVQEFIAQSAAAATDPIGPGNIDVKAQSRYGSLRGRAIDIGERVLYISGGERKLRSMGYEWQRDAWMSVDLAWPSEHITLGLIKDVVFESDPVQLLWMHDRSFLDLIVCAYDREQNKVGWARCPTPGDVHALAVTEFNGRSELWAINQYNIEGVQKNYIEKQSRVFFMDSSKLSVIDNTNIVIGLEHLEGKLCKVNLIRTGALAQATHPDRTVVGGQITLQEVFTGAVVVGLGYQGRLRTLPLEGGSQQGTQQGVQKRYNRIFVRLLLSALPSINGSTPPDRTPATPMDNPEPLFTGDVEVVNLDWDRTAQVDIVTNVPKACTVVGIFGELAANGSDE